MKFVKHLRDLSGGKPVGFKLCIGKKEEFINICEAMETTGIKPDFITVDGGEGGTGAAPVEFSNSIGTPLRDGLAFAIDALRSFDLKKDIIVIASGKIFSAFHMARVLAIGADMCNSARAMMLATGCIQALQCNSNTCPTGVATQDPGLMKGLDVNDKAVRVASFHEATIKSFLELLAASGIERPSDITRAHINRRVNMSTVVTYEDLYPGITRKISILGE
jgi:glutamate synthase domain-containing protein 2